jgi:hypothetical protein
MPWKESAARTLSRRVLSRTSITFPRSVKAGGIVAGELRSPSATSAAFSGGRRTLIRRQTAHERPQKWNDSAHLIGVWHSRLVAWRYIFTNRSAHVSARERSPFILPCVFTTQASTIWTYHLISERSFTGIRPDPSPVLVPILRRCSSRSPRRCSTRSLTVLDPIPRRCSTRFVAGHLGVSSPVSPAFLAGLSRGSSPVSPAFLAGLSRGPFRVSPRSLPRSLPRFFPGHRTATRRSQTTVVAGSGTVPRRSPPGS